MFALSPIIIALAIFPVGSHGAPVQADDVCPRLGDVLCVRDVLLNIASMTKNISRHLNELETSVLEKVHIIDTVNYYISYEMEFIHTHLPKPQLHTQFNQVNNINQVRKASLPLVRYETHCLERLDAAVVGSPLCDEFLLQFHQRYSQKEGFHCRFNRSLVVENPIGLTQRHDLSISKHPERLFPNVAIDWRSRAHRIFPRKISWCSIDGPWNSNGRHRSTSTRMDAKDPSGRR